MNTYDIQLIAMDMDGTLLDAAQKISEANLFAIKQAMAQGIKIAICSGRLPGDAGCYALKAGLNDCAIFSLNGAYCMERPLGMAYCNHVLTEKAFDNCLQLLVSENAKFSCFMQNRMIIIDKDCEPRVSQWGGPSKMIGAPEWFHGMNAIERFRDEGVNKLVYSEEDPAMLEKMRECFTRIEGIEVTSSWSNNIELMPAGINKGMAVSEFAQRLGLNASQVMTFGDYDNDETMIAYAGLGVAMGNATDKVKRAAKHVTLTNEEDGVAVAIRTLALH